MSDLAENAVIAANGTDTLGVSGTIQLSIGNGAADDFDSASIAVKIGNTTLTDLGTVTAATIKNITLPRAPVITTLSFVTTGGGESTQAITVKAKTIVP